MTIERKIHFIGWEPGHYDSSTGFTQSMDAASMASGAPYPMGIPYYQGTTIRPRGLEIVRNNATSSITTPDPYHLYVNLNPVTQTGEVLDSTNDFWLCFGYYTGYNDVGGFASSVEKPQVILSGNSSDGVYLSSDDRGWRLTVAKGGAVVATTTCSLNLTTLPWYNWWYTPHSWRWYIYPFRVILAVSGWGTSSTSLQATMLNQDGTTIYASARLTNMDTTGYLPIDSLYMCRGPITSYGPNNELSGNLTGYLFTYITNFDPTRCFFDYTTSTSNSGSGFSGNTTSFTTIPPTYGVDYNGLYTNVVDSYVLFNYQATRNMISTLPTRHTPLAFVLESSTNMSGTNQVGSVQPLIANGDKSVITNFGDSATVADTGTSTFWTSFDDPITGGKYIDSSNAGLYTFGIKRVA